MDFDSFEQQAFEKFFNEERETMAAEGYAESNEATLRKVAMREILENSKCYNFDAFVPYLAMNYFDRFISRNRLPKVLGRVRDDTILAAICCLTLAWKVRDATFRYWYFEKDRHVNEDYKKHIKNMELQILIGLRWRMRPVTALYFEKFFVEKIPVGNGIKRRTLHKIIVQTQGDINFTQFKPSVIAASAFITACRILYPSEYKRCKREMLATICIKEEELESCSKNIYEMCIYKQILLERNKQPRRVVKFGQTSSSIISKEDSGLQVPGKEPMLEHSEIEEVSEVETDPSLFSGRPGKEPLVESPIEGDEEGAGLNFELKWSLMSSDVPDDIVIDSPRFRTMGPNDDTDQAPAGDDSTYSAKCTSCTIM